LELFREKMEPIYATQFKKATINETKTFLDNYRKTKK